MAPLSYSHAKSNQAQGPARKPQTSTTTLSWNVIYSPMPTDFKTLKLNLQHMHTTEMPPLLYVVILLSNCGLLAETVKHNHKRP